MFISDNLCQLIITNQNDGHICLTLKMKLPTKWKKNTQSQTNNVR